MLIDSKQVSPMLFWMVLLSSALNFVSSSYALGRLTPERLCTRATVNDGRSWNNDGSAWVENAKRSLSHRGIGLEDCADLIIKKRVLAANSKRLQDNKNNDTNNLKYRTNLEICRMAIDHVRPNQWEGTWNFSGYVSEAKNRGFTPYSCAKTLQFTQTQHSAAKVRASPSSAARNKHAVAVIIGNSNYFGRIPKVDFARNDAIAVKWFVQESLGYDPENIIDLRDATQAQMQTAFGNERSHEGKLWRYLDPKGRSDVLVFYSGHGVPGLKDRRGYLLPVDADPEAPEINGYPLDTLLANLGKLEAKSVTVFLDACFSGQSQKGNLVRSASGLMITPRLPKNPSGRLTVITASQGDQIASWDEQARHGLFTRHLLDALKGKADEGEYGNNDNRITLAEVRNYLDDTMTRAARRTYGRHQNAWFRGDDDQVLVGIGVNK